jgi:hypothetical protein
MKNSGFKLEGDLDLEPPNGGNGKFGHGKKRSHSHHHQHTDSFEFQGHDQKTEMDPKKCGGRKLHARAFIFARAGLHRGR